MPIYEYRCSDCGHELEALQKMSEAALTDCPQCGNQSLKKKVSAVAFRLKGSGWYETDFKSGNKKNLSEYSDSSKADNNSGKAADKTTGSADSKTSNNSGASSSKQEAS